MENLSGFLSKFKHLLHSQKLVEKTIIEVCEDVIGFSPDIKVRRGVCYIKNTGPIKSQVFINKSKIKEEVNNRLGKKIITDLR